LPAVGVHPVQRWRGELGAESGWLPGDQGPLPQQEQLTSMTGPCGWHATQCRLGDAEERYPGIAAHLRACAHAVRTSRAAGRRARREAATAGVFFWVAGPGKTLAAAGHL
jgi:hypothetical protein